MFYRIWRITAFIVLAMLVVACTNSPTQSIETGSLDLIPTVGPTATATTAPPEPTATPAVEAEAISADVIEAAVSSATEDIIGTIVVGSRDTTEQQILGALMVQLLRANGYDVADSTGYGSARLVRDALEVGEINLYPEYNSTALSLHHGIPAAALPDDAVRTYELAKTLDAANGYAWLKMAEFSSSYTMLVRDALVDQGIVTLDDLSELLATTEADLKICVESEFFALREGGLRPLMAHYDLQIPEENIIITSSDGAYNELRSGACDIAEGIATDARIGAWGFTTLVDSRQFFPNYNPSPVIDSALLARFPETVDLLNTLFNSLSSATIRNLNMQVDLGADGEFNTGDERKIADVAQDYLNSAGLLGDAPKLTLGTIDSLESNILTGITRQVLEGEGFDVVVAEFNSSQDARDALLSNEVDLVWENTTRVLAEFHNLPLNTVPNNGFLSYEIAKSLDERYAALTWLKPLNWDNRLTAVMRRDAAAGPFTYVDDVFAELAQGNAAGLRLCAEPAIASLFSSNAQSVYNIDTNDVEVTVSDIDTMYVNLRDEACDILLGRSIDPRIPANGFRRVPDPNERFPATANAPIVRTLLTNQYPQMETLLADSMALLDTDEMTTLMAQIEFGADGEVDTGDEVSLDTVVANFLEEASAYSELPTIVIGAQQDAAQLALAEISADVLREAGFNVIERFNLRNAEAAYSELTSEIIDVYWSFSGDTLEEIHVVDQAPADPAAAYELAKLKDEEIGLLWLDSAEFNNAYTLLTPSNGLPRTVTTVSDLAQLVNQDATAITVCVDENAFTNDGAITALAAHYGFAIAPDRIVTNAESDPVVDMLAGVCNVSISTQANGHIAASNLRVLADDLGFFAARTAAPVVLNSMVEEYPEAIELLNAVSAELSNAVVQQFLYRMQLGPDGILDSRDEESVKTVAHGFTCEVGLTSTGCGLSNSFAMSGFQGDLLQLVSNCDALDLNGTFEEDRVWRIPITRSSAQYSDQKAHSGDWSMQIGAQNEGRLESHSIAQTTITIPNNVISADLSFWYYPDSLDTLGGDSASLYVFDETLSIARDILEFPIDQGNAWSQATFDLLGYRGDTIIIHILVINDGDGIPSTIFVDDLQMKVCTDQEAQ